MVNSWSSDCIIYLACGFINVVHVCQVGLGCHKCELSSDVIYDYKLHRFYRCEFDRMLFQCPQMCVWILDWFVMMKVLKSSILFEGS